MATAGHNLSAINPDLLPSGQGMKIACVVAEWNSEITHALYEGAKEALQACGVLPNDIHHFTVPGTVEITYAAKKLCQGEHYNAIIAIGNVIQGQTRHFDFVCDSVTQGVTQLNLDYDTPVIFCVLTDNTIEQSRARSGGEHGNKGVEAAAAAIQMAGLRNLLS